MRKEKGEGGDGDIFAVIAKDTDNSPICAFDR